MSVPLNLGIRAHDLGQLSLLELTATLKKYGLKHIQLAPKKSFPESVPELTAISVGTGLYVKSALEQEQLGISVLGCYVNLIDSDNQKRQKALDAFKTHLRVATSFGVSLVGTETGSVAEGYTEKNFTEVAYQRVLVAVKELVSEAEKFGVVVAIEGGINHPLFSIAQIERLLQEIPSNNLQIILDCTNLLTIHNYHTQDKLIEEALNTLGERIAHFHLKDYRVINQQLEIVPIGQGQFNFRPVLSYLKYRRPHLTATMEETKEPHIQTSIAFLKNLYEEI